ncbi:hypothetical protein MATL_G00211200 [Megalops atlanticus]|uniref:Septin-type G domain-containing protein n=1 Tax=Megalops atlanticus TaxID=7932 RepID=A0A9D3SWW7_MEGAT|nr:hypothetical protein MATL_G00211200 [Megalops atlanticus]
MSDISVNDHLEGILSDFEALKRSFDVEDVDEIPSFPPSSTLNSPFSPTPTLNKSNDGRGPANHTPPSYQTRISIGSSPAQSPVLKNKIVSSLSFNRGTSGMFKTNGNTGSGISRAQSFQSRFNPNGFSSSSGLGSDNDSLHSSSSSLDYQASSKLSTAGLPQSSTGRSEYRTQGLVGPALKKFSSHGNVYRSEVEAPLVTTTEPAGISHGSMPSLDFQSGGVRGLASRYGQTGASWSAAPHLQQREPSFSTRHQAPKPKEPAKLNKFPLDLDTLVSKSQGPSAEAPKPPPRSHPKPVSAPVPASPAVSTSSLDGTGTGSSHSNGDQSEPASAPGPFPVPSVMASPVPLSPAQTPELTLVTQPQVVQLASASPPASTAETVPSEETTHSDESLVSPSKVVSPASDSVELSDKEVPTANESVGLPDKEVPRANESTGSPTQEVPPAVEIVASPVKEVPRANEGVGSPDNEVLQASEGTASSVQEVPQTNESVGSILQRIASFSRVDDTGPAPKVDDFHSNRAKREQPALKQKEPAREEDITQALEPEVQMAEQEAEPEPEAPPPLPREPSPDGCVTGPELFGYVGIEAVLDQMRRKAMKTGFEFNIMVVGQSGLGKSTLVNTLFKSKVSRKSCTPNYEEKISKTVNLQSISHVIEERGVKMKLTVIDTPGFGDQINNENCWEPIVEYINEQYEKYLTEELNVNRKRRIPDTRVHCCVYFLPPTGHWLRPIDVEFMKRLGLIVSIVPVIAKADTLTIEERLEFKQRIRRDLQANGIRVYPQTEYDEDAEDRIMNDKIREKIPFAVVGTDKEHQVNGNKVLGRKTKWGIIEVENVAHCEFANLRDLLIRSHLQDLKDVTHYIHYETYRVRRLNESNLNGQGLSTLTPMNGTTEKSEGGSHL